MKLSKTRTDEALEKDGVWVPIRYGVEVKVARMGNARAEAWRAGLSDEDRQFLEKIGTFHANPSLYMGQIERVNELLIDSMANTVLLDWRGVDAEEDAEDCKEGEPLPFTVDRAKAALTEHDWFFADVQEKAKARETFFRQGVRETGNSSRKPSGGRRSTRTG
jgi:hypothetical protein